jgi:hypothetical protein
VKGAASNNIASFFTSGNVQAVTFDENGHVGILRSSPRAPLDIDCADGEADNTFALRVQNLEATDDRSYGAYIQAGSTATDSALHIYEHTGSNTLFRVGGDGNVGIGTSSPTTDITKFGGSAKGLSVAATSPAIAIRATGNAQHVGYFAQSTTDTFIGAVGGGDLKIQTGTSGLERMRIQSDGGILFYEDTGNTAKLSWSASNERLTLDGSDYQFIK